MNPKFYQIIFYNVDNYYDFKNFLKHMLFNIGGLNQVVRERDEPKILQKYFL